MARPDELTFAPLGGVGEIGITGSAGAVANAVFHATGIRVRNFPIKIEDVVMAHPKVAACAAIGVADEKSGEAVKLFVVPSDPTLTQEELHAYCRENFTGYKMPRHYVFRDALPMTPVGKILRRELRESA